VANSQGLAFAIPSNTILRELPALVTTGSYDQHPWLGVAGTDMTYEIARKMNTNITYGWLIEEVISGGPADKAGLQAKDIIIAIDENRIINGDDLSTYLEEYTMPGQTIDVTIVRNDQTIVIPVELGKRPPS
jgi:S1-C subfamily serine protease